MKRLTAVGRGRDRRWEGFEVAKYGYRFTNPSCDRKKANGEYLWLAQDYESDYHHEVRLLMTQVNLDSVAPVYATQHNEGWPATG